MNSLVVILFGASFIILLVDVFADNWDATDHRILKSIYADRIETMENEQSDPELRNARVMIQNISTKKRDLLEAKGTIVTAYGIIKGRFEQPGYIRSIKHAIKITECIAKICVEVNNYPKHEIRQPEIPGRGQLQAIYVVAATYILTHEGFITAQGNFHPETGGKPCLAPVLNILNEYRVDHPGATNIPLNTIGEYTDRITEGFNDNTVCPHLSSGEPSTQ